ncbi:T9SS type A sorting domain-containing protein [Hymenobacter sp. DH14]|uniref:T9SS type A sorting domain-containing protein n=1 Tax=Hymenobacter cyanobacteriorum TaxID=2926463 RepID=A0A9X1VQ24_9BACT|nr:T9SS type A sorting domain-containing protein [Hymenobacter cyanobacteriorum]MCI1190001.1 T9SS type A sorting domain-containing protein [Hymenobacter cyanobacteriorum]
MRKTSTLVLVAGLAGASLSAQAQITLDGVINANEIGTSSGKYISLGAFSAAHNPASGPTGFGNAGLLRMYGANSSTKLYVALAGTIETSGNNFQLYLDLPNRSGVPVGTALPAIAGNSTVFGTFPAGSIGGTKLELEADAAIATTGTNDVHAAIYTATTGVAKPMGDGLGAPVTSNGVASTLPASSTTGVYSLFAGTRVAYLGSATGLSGNPGNANGGGAGSYALEYEFNRTSLGLPSGASIVKVFAAYVSGDAYWSSDIIPETAGNGTNSGGLNNIGFTPDFTDQTRFPGTQAASLNVVVLSARQADDAVVAMSVFPNPGRGEATVAYQVLGGSQPVAVRVLDLVGREVRTLLNAPQAAGFHELRAGLDDLAAGIYLVKVQVGDKVATRRLEVAR